MATSLTNLTSLSPRLNTTKSLSLHKPIDLQSLNILPVRRHRCSSTTVAYKVTIEHEGQTRTVDVEPDESILSRVLDEGLEVPHDCKLGVCMTCPAKLLSGTIDQSEGMLSDDVVERGYALLCVAYPRSDCVIQTIPEEELLSLQLATSDD